MIKADDGKTNPLLLEVGMAKALAAVNRTLDYGAIKYEAHSWMNVPDAINRYDAAARRHRNLRDQGQVTDYESGLPHIAHEIVCMLMVFELQIKRDPGWDIHEFNDPPQDHKDATESVVTVSEQKAMLPQPPQRFPGDPAYFLP